MGEIFSRLIRVATDKSIQKLVRQIIPPSTMSEDTINIFAKGDTIADNLLREMLTVTLYSVVI